MLLKFNQSGLSKSTKVFGRAIRFEPFCGRTYILSNKELLELFHIITGHAIGKIAGEQEMRRSSVSRFRLKRLKLGFE